MALIDMYAEQLGRLLPEGLRKIQMLHTINVIGSINADEWAFGTVDNVAISTNEDSTTFPALTFNKETMSVNQYIAANFSVKDSEFNRVNTVWGKYLLQDNLDQIIKQLSDNVTKAVCGLNQFVPTANVIGGATTKFGVNSLITANAVFSQNDIVDQVRYAALDGVSIAQLLKEQPTLTNLIYANQDTMLSGRIGGVLGFNTLDVGNSLAGVGSPATSKYALCYTRNSMVCGFLKLDAEEQAGRIVRVVTDADSGITFRIIQGTDGTLNKTNFKIDTWFGVK